MLCLVSILLSFARDDREVGDPAVLKRQESHFTSDDGVKGVIDLNDVPLPPSSIIIPDNDDTEDETRHGKSKKKKKDKKKEKKEKKSKKNKHKVCKPSFTSALL